MRIEVVWAKEVYGPLGREMSFSIIKGIQDALSNKDIALTTDQISTAQGPAQGSNWKYNEQQWEIYKASVFPFPRNWLGTKVVLLISFEYDGYDINNARLRISNDSFVKWWNDSSQFIITAVGAVSKIKGANGSTCVEFDVSLKATFDWIRGERKGWRVRIFGDGSAVIL